MRKSESITIRATPDDRRRLKELAIKFGVPQSEILRMILQTKRLEVTIHPAQPMKMPEGSN
jgi:predicted DNA binding CopG/RHH family protein